MQTFLDGGAGVSKSLSFFRAAEEFTAGSSPHSRGAWNPEGLPAPGLVTGTKKMCLPAARTETKKGFACPWIRVEPRLGQDSHHSNVWRFLHERLDMVNTMACTVQEGEGSPQIKKLLQSKDTSFCLLCCWQTWFLDLWTPPPGLPCFSSGRSSCDHSRELMCTSSESHTLFISISADAGLRNASSSCTFANRQEFTCFSFPSSCSTSCTCACTCTLNGVKWKWQQLCQECSKLE